MESVLLGTDLKIKVELICEGFDMNDDNFSVDIKWGNEVETYDKSNNAWKTDSTTGDWYLCLPTTGKKGTVSMVATLWVPDEDFGDVGRKEVVKQDLFTINKV